MSVKIPTLDKLYILKQKLFTKLKIDSLVRHLIFLGLTPNKITVLGILIGLLSIFYLFKNQTVFGVLYIINRLLDLLDGYTARRFHLKTDIGKRLDHLGDWAIHIGLLIKAIFFPGLAPLAAAALFTYAGECILLKKGNLLHKKFPSGMFAYIFIFGFYKFGLIFQIFYQIFSYTYFQLFLKNND